MNELWSQHGMTIVLGVAVLACAWIAWRMLAPRKKQPGEGIMVNVSCAKCSWQGTVSRYNRVCPKCASRELRDF